MGTVSNINPRRAAAGDRNLLTPAEVAWLFRVDPSTVTRWAKSGKLPFIRTVGGHRRYRRADIEPRLNDWQGAS